MTRIHDNDDPDLTLSNSLTMKGALMEATLPVVIRRTCFVRGSLDLTGNFTLWIDGESAGEGEGDGIS
jgi:hypothetical protein